MMMRHLTKPFLLLTTLLFLAFGAQQAVSADISQTNFIQLSKNNTSLLILDVRTPEEYAQGHIPDAQNIPHTELEQRLGELDSHKRQTVVVYCRSGYRAGIAQSILENAGFTGVLHLDGDMNGWMDSKLPLER